MDTDQLIKDLAEEGAKKPLPHPVKQTLFWLLGTGLYLIAFTVYNGFRPDLSQKLSDPLYLWEAGILFFMALSAALAAFCLSRPDSHQMPWIKYIPFALILPLAITAFGTTIGDIEWSHLFHSMTLGQFDCPWHIFLFSAPPGVAIFFLIRKGAPIHCYWAGTMATWAVTSFGYLCMRLIEQNDNPAHLIVWHALPIFLMCMIGMMVGKLALRWR